MGRRRPIPATCYLGCATQPSGGAKYCPSIDKARRSQRSRHTHPGPTTLVSASAGTSWEGTLPGVRLAVPDGSFFCLLDASVFLGKGKSPIEKVWQGQEKSQYVPLSFLMSLSPSGQGLDSRS